jgi:hypothetical protein
LDVAQVALEPRQETEMEHFSILEVAPEPRQEAEMEH